MNYKPTATFDIKKISDEIQKSFPDINWEIETEHDYISMVFRNDKNPRFPLILYIHEEDGIFVNLSQCGDILECHTDVSEVETLIQNVFNDKIVIAIAYPDDEKFEKQILSSMMRSFYFEDADIDDENDQAVFESFVSRISKPRSFLNRLNVFSFHGVIEISNWSGGIYYKIYRK